ncbi:MAG: hypothetical protein U0822_18615 [Anaerolineae bacterium]
MPADKTDGDPLARSPVALDLGEATTVFLLVFLTLHVLVAYVLDAGGWPIDARWTSLLALGGLALLVALWRRMGWLRPRFDAVATLTWLALVVGLAAFIIWLAWPTLLPLTESSDTTHHASFTEFIMARRTLAHDQQLDAYLGEMVVYPAGAHILAALIGTTLGLPGLRSLHPLLALVVSLKAGLVYFIILRLLPPQRRFPGLALAGALFLFVARDAFLGSFTRWYFFPMVVSETFAIGALWALTAWDTGVSGPHRAALAPLTVYALCGIAVSLIWPTWLPIVALSLVVLVLIRPAMTIAERMLAAAVALGPVVLVEFLYLAGHHNDVGVLGNEGSVLKPSVELYGVPLLALALLGMVVSARKRRTLALWSFTIANLAVLGALWFLALRGRVAFYFGYKMFYLFLYAVVLFAAMGLDAISGWLQSLSPERLAQRWSLISFLLSLLVLGLIVPRGIPARDGSVVEEHLYAAGLWAKANLPNGCVDYLVNSQLASYWLHVQVLGNPRGSPRTEAIVAAFGQERQADERWQSPPGLPYAIVEDINQVPDAFRSQMRVLYTSGPAAVVQRDGVCRDTTTPIDRLTLVSRGETLARRLNLGTAQP